MKDRQIKERQIKEVSNKKNYLVTIVVVLVLAIGTLVLCQVVSTILKESDEKYSKVLINFNSNSFIMNIGNYNYPNAEKILSDQGKKAVDSYLDLSNIAEEDKEFVKRRFEDKLSGWSGLRDWYRNLQYYVYDSSSKESYYSNDRLSSILTAKEPDKELQEYQFLIVMEYDKSGNLIIKYLRSGDYDIYQSIVNELVTTASEELKDLLSVGNSPDYDEYLIEKGLSLREDTGVSYTEELYPNWRVDNLVKPIKDMTFIYGIPKELKYTDGISDMIEQRKSEARNSLKPTLLWMILGVMLATALLALVVPYKQAKNGIIAKIILRFYVEVLIGFAFVAVYTVALVPIYLTDMSYDYGYRLFGLSNNLGAITYNVLKIASLFFSLSVAYLVVIILKHIFHTGVFSYLRNKSIIVRIVFFVGRTIKKWYHNVTTLEFGEKGVKRILQLVGIHTVITIGLCCIWFIGIPVAILYNVLLAVILIKKYNIVKYHYDALLLSTRNIAVGDLETSVEQELGIFNPVRDEINRLREGLQHAVEEEMKSQNMKTELITNVSHDLKTPLTSIITYVDLLKSDSLTDEERHQYVNVLEQKSGRLKILIEGLFEVSKTTSKSIVLSRQNLDLVTLIKEVLVEFEDKLKEACLKVKADYQEEKMICFLDGEKTYRVLENLFTNIVKYAMSNTRVYLTVCKTEKQAKIIIKNISYSEINYQGEQLFERFVRGDLSRNTEGSGLGLAIAKGLTEVQGGTIGIEVDGDLFKVTVSFPLSLHTEQAMTGSEKETNL